jgi:hypothetical protein
VTARSAVCVAALAVLLVAPAARAEDAIAAPEPAAEAGAPVPTEAAPATPATTEAAPAATEKEDHKGFLFRFTLGLGWAWLFGHGALSPAIGLRAVEDPSHDSPALNLSMDFGGGFKNIGLHVGGVIERMILRADEPTEMGFTLFGVGGGLSYYFTDYDFYATAQIRFVGMLVYLPGVLCDVKLGEKYQSYEGPGVTFGLGKEWFGDDDKGLGLGLQGNYAKLRRDGGAEFDYVSVMLALTFTHF